MRSWSAFTFYRGTALNMAADLAATPSSGIRTQLCGDCHILNFGGFATPERRVIFDINDFDETLPGPWEWDVKRLAVSFVHAARSNGFTSACQRDAALACVRSYRERITKYAEQGGLDVWYASGDEESYLASFSDRRAVKRAHRIIAREKSRTIAEYHFPRMVDAGKDGFVIKDNPPLVSHDKGISQENAHEAFASYRKSLPDVRRFLLDRHRPVVEVWHSTLVPPSWDGYRNDYALEAAQKHPDRFAVMGEVSLNDPASRAKLPTWLDQPGMKGFRISFRHSGTHSLLDDGSVDWFWRNCERYDIPVMIFAPFAVAVIGKIAERHRGLRVIVDHMGLNVQWKGKPLVPGVDLFLTFARLPNVAVKASCLPCYVAEKYPFPTLHPQIRRVLDAFGPQRIMWGTDLSQSPISYRQNVTLFTEELDFLSASDREWIMGKTLGRWQGQPVLRGSH